jgi:hypothetical protein
VILLNLPFGGASRPTAREFLPLIREIFRSSQTESTGSGDEASLDAKSERAEVAEGFAQVRRHWMATHQPSHSRH